MMRSLRAQLSLSILLVLLFTVLLSSIFAYWFINREFEKYVARQEIARSESIADDVASQYNVLTRTWNEDSLHTIGMYSLYDGYILKMYDADGAVLWDAENHDVSLCGQIMGEISARMERAKRAGSFVTHTFDIDHGGRNVGSVSIMYYGPYFFSDNEFRFIRALSVALLLTGILAALFSVIAGSLLARRISRPVTVTVDIAAQIARGNYDIRFESGTKTRELNELVTAVNCLAGALGDQENLRKRLTTDVAHELRTPLSAVGSHLEAMIDGLWQITPERLKSCHEEIVRLGKLVSDLENLAKIEGGDLKLNKSPVDLSEIARTAGENLKAEAAKKSLSLSIGGGPSVVDADRDRMLQVVTNLLSNAIKYSPEGGHISIEVTDTAADGIIRVIDGGTGIPENELPFIFERFYRADKSRSRKTGGSGIGLTIARSIATAHGGTITADSEQDRGSRFTVTIPKKMRTGDIPGG